MARPACPSKAFWQGRQEQHAWLLLRHCLLLLLLLLRLLGLRLAGVRQLCLLLRLARPVGVSRSRCSRHVASAWSRICLLVQEVISAYMTCS